MKPLTLLLLLSLPLFGQVTGLVERVKIEYITPTERANVTPEKGALFFDETDPSQLFVGDGVTAGGVQVSPQTSAWDHSATQNIKLNAYRLQLGNGFEIKAIAGYSMISGNGSTIQGSGSSARWGTSSNPFIRLSSGQELAQITSFTWDDNTELFTAVMTDIDAGVPSIETTDDLVTPNWVAHPATVTGPTMGSYTATFAAPAGGVAFFRAVYGTAGANKIELLMPVEAAGNLDVTGTITGSLSVTNLVGQVTSAQIETAVTDDIAEGVTAHGWGDHSAAGYLTQQTTTYTLGFYEAPDDSDLDWLLVARAATIDDAAPGQAWCRTTHTAQTTYTITKNGGASLGTIVFDADPDQTGTITLTGGDITLSAGDRIEINAPTTADSTGADIQVTLVGVLQ